MKTNKQTNKQTNILKLSTLTLFITLFLIFIQSCSTEESITQNIETAKTVNKEEAIQFLKTLETKGNISSKNTSMTFDFNKITQEKLSNTSALLTVVPIISENKKQRTRALLLKIDNVIETILYNEYPESASTKNSFTGIILMSKLNGDFIRAYRLKNNEYVIDLIPTKKTINKNSTSAKEINATNPEQLDEVYVYNYYRNPSYSYVPLEYNNQNPYAHADMFLWDSGSSGGGNYYPPTAEEIAKTIEDSIDDSELDPCTKAIMEKLKNATHSDIAKMLSRFAPAGSIFNINMSIGQIKDNGNWAETKKTTGSTTDVNMIFNENYINGVGNPNRPTDLSIATTMVHEMIHAYLISLLEENKTCGASGICDFPTIYDAYVQKQIDKGSNILADAHHELIAKQYVFTIATTIQEFHTGQYTDYPYQNYLDMAWGGLQGTYIFNKNYPDDPTHKNYKDRERILARINAERKGSQYYGALPLGTPCKK